jgi:hypothetical protein
VRQFAHKGLRIDQLSVEAKLVYSAFCLLSLAALAVSVVYYYDLVGTRPVAGVKQYYAGEAPAPAAAADPGADRPAGPAIVLPEDEQPEAAPPKLIAPMTARKLLEVTHFHLFTLPVFLLIITHLFMMCRVRPGLRIGLILAGIAGSALHLAAPWAVFAGGAGWAWLMPVSGVWMSAAMLIMTGWPLAAMWRPGVAAAGDADAKNGGPPA